MLIAENIKNRLKSIPVEDVAEALGLAVSRHNCLCFSHDDHHPSLVFNPNSNTWRCYACGIHGDCISLVQQKLGLGFVDACMWLCGQFGVISSEVDATMFTPANSAIPSPKPRAAVKKEGNMPDMDVLEFVSDKCKFRSADADRFLYKERRYKRTVVEKLKVGFVGTYNGMGKLLVERFGEDRALRSGMVYKRGDRFVLAFNSPCLIFSYFDRDGKLQSLQSRYLGKEDKPRFQFARGCRPGIFNQPILNEIGEGEDLYVSEGVTDCISLMSDGLNAIAIPSATLLNNSDIELLAKYTLKMYPDQDEPGKRLFSQLKEKVEERGGRIECLSLPTGMKDYSDYYMHNHGAGNDGAETSDGEKATTFLRKNGKYMELVINTFGASLNRDNEAFLVSNTEGR